MFEMLLALTCFGILALECIAVRAYCHRHRASK
jgi:hypothetical protein